MPGDDNVVRYRFDELEDPTYDWERERTLLARLNDPATRDPAVIRELLAGLFLESEGATIVTPLDLTYGRNIRLGRKVYINRNVLLDGAALITIGHHSMIGFGAQLITATHPIEPGERQRWALWAAPITIGENVWIGASAIISAGVTIGDHSVISAGTVVGKDIPSCVLAAGNPCRVIRELERPDRATLYELNP